MKIVVALLLSLAIIVASTRSPKELYEKFKRDYQRKYGCPEEEKARFIIFKKALEMIKETNEAFEKGKSSFKMAINNFADAVGTEVPHGRVFHGQKPRPPPIQEFNKFKADYRKTYQCPESEKLRFHIFEINFDRIMGNGNRKNSMYPLGISADADLLPEELRQPLSNPPAQKK